MASDRAVTAASMTATVGRDSAALDPGFFRPAAAAVRTTDAPRR
jgi:hypothetical protein